MWRRLIEAAVLHPVTVTMLTITVLIFGVVAAQRLPVELLPELAFPTLTVQTELPDAAPREVEELVTRPVEERVGGVPGVISIEAISSEGHSDVVLEFAWGTSIDQALADVREKLDRVTLPPRAIAPLVLRYDPSQEPVVRLGLREKLAGPPTAADRSRLRYLAETTIKRALEKVPGVAAVEVHGGEEDELAVELDPERMAALGVTSSEIATAITRSNVNRPGGAVDEGDERYLVRTLHETRTPADIGAIVVRTNPDGAALRIRDVATVRRQPLQREELRLLGGEEAVELDIYREGDANIVAVARNVLQAVETLGRAGDVELVVLSNRATFIESAIETVRDNVVSGGVLAILVLLFFLRDVRATAVIAVAIPVSVVATFIPLQMLGVSLNIMSLGGLALGVGMLTDNSIVVLEAIARREADAGAGADVDHLVARGTAEVAPAVFASTLTTVAVFLPIAFVEGVAGQLVRDLSYAVSFSILSSMLVSLLLVPVLQKLGRGSSTLASSSDEPKLSTRAPLVFALVWPFAKLVAILHALGRLLARAGSTASRPADRAYRAIESLYPPILRWSLRHRFFVLVLTALMCGGAAWAAWKMPRTLVPELVENEFTVQVTLPSGASLERTGRMLRRLQQLADEDPEVASSFARAGRLRVAGQAQGIRLGSHLGELGVHLVPGLEDPEASQKRVMAQLRAANPEPAALLQLSRPSLLETAPPVEVRLFGEDPGLLSAHAQRIATALDTLPEVEEVAADDLRGRPEVDVTFDRDRLERLGLTIEDVAAAVERAVAGEVATTVFAADQQLDVRVRLPLAARTDRERLGAIVVGMVEGVPIRLAAVAHLEPAVGPAQLRRIEGRRGMRISAQSTSLDLEQTKLAVEDLLESHADPRSGITTEVAGQAEDMQESLRSLAFTAALSIFLVYGVMASTFESLMHPFLIMFTVPIAGAGALYAAWAAGVPLSAMVGIGLIVLCGIVVNNAIVLVDAVNIRRGAGLAVEDALVEAGGTRLRPIAMTTLTTIVGLVPMSLGLGDAAAMRQPLAVAVIGGLGLATVLTLVVLPCAYSLFPGPVRKAWK